MSGPIARRLPHVPAGLLACAVLFGLAVPAGGLARGGAGAVGAALGVAVVTASYLVSGLALAWADSVNPQLVMPVGMLTYVVKFAALGVGLAVAAGGEWAGLVPFALAMAAAVFVWTGAQIWWTWRARLPYVELDPPR
jgi:hypothetical protein